MKQKHESKMGNLTYSKLDKQKYLYLGIWTKSDPKQSSDIEFQISSEDGKKTS